jgi:AraC-like DNA-binding protein/tetratricopeptide (TPR) repeat protein
MKVSLFKYNNLLSIFWLFFSVFSFSQSEKTMNLLYENFEKNINNPKKSKIFANTYLKNGKILNDKYHIITGYSMVVNHCNLIDGEKCLDSMMRVAKEYDKTMVTFTLLRKGQFYCIKRKLKQALENYLLAYKNIENNDDFYLGHIKYEIAIVKGIMGKRKEALAEFLSMEKQLRNSNKVDQYIKTIFAISNTYFQLGKIENSEKYTDLGLKLTKSYKMDEFHYLFVCNRGKNYYINREYDFAIHDLTNSLDIIKNTNDFANYSEICYFLGKCYKETYKNKKALVYFNRIDSVFNVEGYIFPDIINSYKVLIEEAKNKKDVNQTLYYTSQFLKADSVIKQNYDYIIDTTHKEYDVPELMIQKEKLIEKIRTNSLILNLFFIGLIILLLLGFWQYHKIRKKEVSKQKALFDAYLINNELKIVQVDNEKIIERLPAVEIHEDIIESLLIKLDLFEKSNGFKDDVTLDVLAKKLETNTSYLSMIINKHKNCSFPTYINNLRIDLAIELLQSEKKYRLYSIKGLADEVGFTSTQTFSRAFLAKTGVNASFFVNELKNK